jgi:hypothetical protein
LSLRVPVAYSPRRPIDFGKIGGSKKEATFSRKSSLYILSLKVGVLRALSTPAHKYTIPLHNYAGVFIICRGG